MEMPSAHLGNSFDNTCITPFVGRFVPKLTNRCALKPILCEDCQSIRAQVLVDSRHRRLPELLLQTDFARAHSLQVRCGPFRSYCSKSTSLEPARSKSISAPARSRFRSSRLAPSLLRHLLTAPVEVDFARAGSLQVHFGTL